MPAAKQSDCVEVLWDSVYYFNLFALECSTVRYYADWIVRRQ